MNVELSKLKALNKTNLEIWERLCATQTSQNQQQPRERGRPYRTLQQQCDVLSEMGRVSPWNSVHQSVTAMSFDVYCLSSVSFDGNTLNFTFDTESIGASSFSQYFPKNINFFNDQLPSTQYFDLSDILDKYDYLDKSKVGDILIKWKKALEEIQVVLGTLETKLIEKTELTSKIEDLFLNGQKIDKNNSNNNNLYGDESISQLYQFSPKNNNKKKSDRYSSSPNMTFTFDVSCNESNYTTLELFATALHTHYTSIQRNNRNGFY